MNELTTPTPELSEQIPAGAPSTEGMDQSSIAELLGKVNQGESAVTGQEGQSKQVLDGALDDTGVEGNVNQTKPAEKSKPEFDIPEKFRNQDGSLNQANIVKSYGDVESSHGKLRSQAATANQNAITMQNDIEDLTSENESLRADLEASRDMGMSEDDQRLLQENPMAYRDKIKADEKHKSDELGRKQRSEDSRMNAMATRCRADLPGFSDLEAEITKLSEGRVYSRHPDSIPEMYFSALGRKTESIAKISRLEGEKVGYARAKADMSKHVESGGKSSAMTDIGNVNQEQIDNSSQEELEAMVTNHGY